MPPLIPTPPFQFLLGRDVLAAPVLDRNVSKVHVYLPPGDTWRDVWTNARLVHQPSKVRARSERGPGSTHKRALSHAYVG